MQLADLTLALTNRGDWLDGRLARVAIYGAALSASQVAQHYWLGTGAPTATPTETPTDTATDTFTPTPTPGIAIDAGGPGAGVYVADTDYAGGSAVSTTDAIDTSGVADPAPQAVYQTARAGDATYTVPGLVPGAPYTVRLHFADPASTGPDQRLFAIAIDGALAWADYDIYAAAGARTRRWWRSSRRRRTARGG